MNIIAIFAATAALNWTMLDGKVVTETQELVPFDDGVKLELSRDKILSMNAKRLDVIPDFAHAKRGEGGYWFTPYGVYGEYDRDNGSFFAGAERMSMPMFGWSNPRGACLAIVTSLKYFVRDRSARGLPRTRSSNRRSWLRKSGSAMPGSPCPARCCTRRRRTSRR